MFCNNNQNQMHFNEYDMLISKIYRFLSAADKKRVKTWMRNATPKTMDKTFQTIYALLAHYAEKYKLQPQNHHEYIIPKIHAFLQATQVKLIQTPKTKQIQTNQLLPLVIADVGGGNGNVLSGLNKRMHLPKEHMLCIETRTDWTESYPFDNDDITYLFWQNNVMPIADESCDVVCCMVSLHHMTPATCSNAIREIHRILKPNGRFLIKEHDVGNQTTLQIVLWEHYLYHLLDCAYARRGVNTSFYFEHCIHHFQTKDNWRHKIEQAGFTHTTRTNRFLDGEYNEHETINCTRLYWDMFKKT